MKAGSRMTLGEKKRFIKRKNGNGATGIKKKVHRTIPKQWTVKRAIWFFDSGEGVGGDAEVGQRGDVRTKIYHNP